ncbi:MAG: DUF4153 domain-containing protein [Lachnospiraceae bacterium]|nr:DUF4153 domain-containing protein [Lachnospiraceae bacterium]
MLKKLKNFYETIKENVFLKYPVAICVIWVASLITAISVDFPYDSEYYDFLQKLTAFFWIFAAGNLFVEELFERQKKIVRIIGFLVSAAISAFFILIASIEQDYIFGIETEDIQAFVAKVLICYLSWIAMLCVFKMYKKSEVNFEKYCLSVFGSAMRTSIVYGIFALGIAIIILIFDVLIFDTDDIIVRIETFLACGLYIPGMILAFSKVQEEIGKFLRVVVKYVLLILEMAAFVIIYLYIAKLVISWELPSNEVFPILSWLFVCGLPIWTMAMYFKEDKLGKIAAFLPYIFIPFIILQAICIGLRIQEYGLTDSRYICCYLILAEIIYLILFSIKGRKRLPSIFIIAAVLVTMFYLAPVINSDTMVYLSQKTRFENLMQKAKGGSELTDKEIQKVLGAYQKLQYLPKGEEYVDGLSASCLKMIKDYRENHTFENSDYHDYSYVSMRWSTQKYGLDVSDYQMVYNVNLYADINDYERPVDLNNICFEIEGEEKTIDLSNFAKSAWDYYEDENDGEDRADWLYQNGRIKLSDGSEIVVYELNENFRDDTCIYFRAEAYYLK